MDEMTDIELLQRYRRDRYDLLHFILTAGILEEVIVPPGALSLEDVDLDQVNVEFVLERARRRSSLELQEAIKKQYLHYKHLPKVNLVSRDIYFLATDPELAGPPPARVPPPKITTSLSCVSVAPSQTSTLQSSSLHSISITEDIKHCIDLKEDVLEENTLRRKTNSTTDLVSSLPPFLTGLSDDDLRETAYEVLLASVGGAVGLISPAKDRRDENKLNLSRKFPHGVQDKYQSKPARTPGLAGLLETMRIQMEISKSMDKRTREALLRAATGKVGKRMDTLLIPLEFLFVVSPDDFGDMKEYSCWRKRQLNLLEEGIIIHPAINLEEPDKVGSEMRSLIAKVEEAKETTVSGETYFEALRALQAYASLLAERAREGDQMGEFCHWADGYHLNVRLYEMLLCSVFDIMNEGKIMEEVEEILELLKSTWRVLGISQTVHDACYTWVLFRQFSLTGEESLLYNATQQMKRIAPNGQRSAQERVYMKSLRSITKSDGSSTELTYVQSLLIPIKLWVDKRLEDYHLHFSEALDKMEALVTVAMVTSKLIADEADQSVNIKGFGTAEMTAVAKQAKDYICSSIQLAYERALNAVNIKMEIESKHPLLLLAEDVKEIVIKDESMFSPILSRWNHEALAISASLVHNLYQKELKPFLDKISDLDKMSDLTDEVEAVISATDSLEEYLRSLVSSVGGECNTYQQCMVPYQLEVVAGNLVMQWVESKLKRVTDCVQQSILDEDWTPISTKLRHAKSVLYVFNILQETMDQFLSLRLPVRLPQLRSLVNSLDNTLQLYCNCILKQMGPVADLVPPAPSLTCYQKETVAKVFSRRKCTEAKAADEEHRHDPSHLSTMKLCIRLNTLHHMLCQVDTLEANLKERWAMKRPSEDLCFNSDNLSKHKASNGDRKWKRSSNTSEEFFIGFVESRKFATLTIEKVCEFTGTKIIYSDMRESFIDSLYKGSVSSSRIDKVVHGLDLVLGQLVETIVEPLRDQIVMGLLQASLSGLLRVMLDGGPSRAFSQSDVYVLEEDLQTLKDFFIADGDGLPAALVENAADYVKQVLELFRSETSVIIQNLKQAGEETENTHTPKRTAKRASRSVEVLLRVLCHKTDREASKFVKKYHKFPKVPKS